MKIGGRSQPGRVTSRLGKDETKSSERLDVRHVIECRTGRLFWLGAGFCIALGFARLWRVLFGWARTQHLHLAGNDLDHIAILTFLILPFTRLNTSFDVDWRTLLEVL